MSDEHYFLSVTGNKVIYYEEEKDKLCWFLKEISKGLALEDVRKI